MVLLVVLLAVPMVQLPEQLFVHQLNINLVKHVRPPTKKDLSKHVQVRKLWSSVALGRFRRPKILLKAPVVHCTFIIHSHFLV